jgi:hypothetical protein
MPGYSLIPIKVSMQPDLATLMESRGLRVDSQSSHEGPEQNGTDILSTFQDELANYTSVLKLETFGEGKDDVEDNEEPKQQIIFQELGRLKPRTAMHIVEVQKSVGWNIDPFTKMPKFRDKRVDTTEIYYHCLKMLGRVGKSPGECPTRDSPRSSEAD